jgi:hypothetical protein
MSADPNKKSARTFQCRDVLWETFEQMARELECSVDYLINEAMKQYARQRSYGGTRTPYPAPGREPSSDRGYPPGPHRSTETGPPAPLPPPGRPATASNLPPLGRVPPPPARPSPMTPPPRGGGGLPAPVPARAASSVGLPPVPMSGGGPSSGMPRSGPPPAARSVPPPLPRAQTPIPPVPPSAGANGFPSAAGHVAALKLVYNGEVHEIRKDRFVIGRGKQSSDLTLKDPNVSRQHAMIEFQNGVYFMVDMGSTNGVEYNGQRIARKQIAEGDVFRICDHDIQFTYR